MCVTMIIAVSDTPFWRQLKDKKNHASRLYHYKERDFHEHKLDTIQYPVSPLEIPQLEESLGLRLNVFSYSDDAGKAIYPLYISKR